MSVVSQPGRLCQRPRQISVTKLLGCWFLMVHNQAFSNGRSLLGRIEATSLGDTQELNPSVTCTLPPPNSP